jgi:hypothetical protein
MAKEKIEKAPTAELTIQESPAVREVNGEQPSARCSPLAVPVEECLQWGEFP